MKEHGGSLELNKKWAESFLVRRGFVKRKATKADRKLSPDYPDLNLAYLKRVKDEVEAHHMPWDMVFNWGQTGLKLAPDYGQRRL